MKRNDIFAKIVMVCCVIGLLILMGWHNYSLRKDLEKCIEKTGGDFECDSCYYSVYGVWPEEL